MSVVFSLSAPSSGGFAYTKVVDLIADVSVTALTAARVLVNTIGAAVRQG